MTCHTQEKTCSCFSPGAKASWIESTDVGLSDDCWYITRMRCASCGKPWLQAFLEHKDFSRSGRYYRLPVTDTQLEVLTAAAAQHLIEAAESRIAGGSKFSRVECLVEGPIGLLATL